MTDAELDRLTQRCAEGDPKALRAYNALVRKATRCEFSGCKQPVAWISTKLWGKGGTIRTCDAHRPGAGRKPGAPPTGWYDTRPINDRSAQS